MDIDNLKQINDTYGHATGDAVLRTIAKTLQKNLRPSDFVGRWGGEEFIAIIRNVDEHGLHDIGSRFRLLIEKSAVRTGAERIRATVSVGATLASDNDTLKTLVDRADQLMYRSKNAGKNRLTTDSSTR
jgi:diguanylate cyclase (GGDEF)-like protein